MNAPPKKLDATVLRLLEQNVTPVPRVVQIEAVPSSPRSAVLRLRLAGGTWPSHDRVVVKQVVGAGAGERFDRELVALRVLASLDIGPPVAPKLLAWDRPARLFLLEDLGDRGLATTLFGQDRAAAQAAMLDFASALGRLHAGTAGYESRAADVGQALGVAPGDLGNPRDPQRDGEGFRRLCEAAGVAVDSTFDDDVNRVEALLAAPGPFRVLTHGDPCPGNERLTDRGLVFFDFESSGFDHALLDGAYLMMAFPTCWCVGTIPREVLAGAQEVYRQTLATGVPEAADAAAFARHLLYASARWLLSGDAVVPRAQRGDVGRLVTLMAVDWPWGPSTARQRLLYRLRAFTQFAHIVDELHGVAATATRLHRVLASRWPPDVYKLTNFPAFGCT